MTKSLCARGAAGVLGVAALTILAGGNALADTGERASHDPSAGQTTSTEDDSRDSPRPGMSGVDIYHANAGSGNTGIANAGSGNSGIANAGFGNPGNANAGVGNIGNGNAGVTNCGNVNAGVNNHGNAHVGVWSNKPCDAHWVSDDGDDEDRPVREPRPAERPAPEPAPQRSLTPASAPEVQAGERLANTGVDPLTAAVLGAGMLAGGGVLLASRRRRVSEN